MIAPARLRKVMGSFATGVGVVATRTPEGEHVGLTVNSLTSVSLDPPLILVCLDRDSASLDTIRTAGHFSVSILSADQAAVALRFAKKDRSIRFEGLEVHEGPTGAPFLTEAIAWIDCALSKEVEAGDHVLVLGKVVAAELSEADRPDPLVFFRGRYGTHS